jgi:hypothetical protein
MSSPRKSYPDFELYMHRKIQTTALGERIDNLCNRNNNSAKQQKGGASVSSKPQKIVTSVSQPELDILRRSKRIRSPSLSICTGSPSKIRKLECQVWFHLEKWFTRLRLKCEKWTFGTAEKIKYCMKTLHYIKLHFVYTGKVSSCF